MYSTRRDFSSHFLRDADAVVVYLLLLVLFLLRVLVCIVMHIVVCRYSLYTHLYQHPPVDYTRSDLHN